MAVATPPGRGAIAIVRLSGERAWPATRRHLKTSEVRPRRPTLCEFLGPAGMMLDRVLVTHFPAPASYTGEDVVEICCHGSPVLTASIIESLLAEGVRLAEPGEFSMRAFFNGKMDLAQAEAVRDLVESRTRFQARVASEQLEGRLSLRLRPAKEEIIRVICHLETTLEFVEDEVEPQERAGLLQSIRSIEEDFAGLAGNFSAGRIVREGIEVVLAGRTNVGKSSIFNVLLEEERAIVTAVPGTTRDALTEYVSLDGVPARLVDTAGIRESSDLVERIGVDRSRRALAAADVVVFVVDCSVEWQSEDQRIWERIEGRPVVTALNKQDLEPVLRLPAEVEEKSEAVLTSAKEKSGIAELKAAVLKAVAPEGVETEDLLVTSLRHQRALKEAVAELGAATQALERGESEEFASFHLRRALDALGQITGETTTDDILGQIFSTFCIGK